MKKSIFDHLYIGASMINKKIFVNTKARPGVYVIKDKEEGNILYVGHSKSHVYKTITRHFQIWNDPVQERKIYNNRNVVVRVIFCNKEQAQRLERLLIIKYRPKHNTDKFEYYSKDQEDKKVFDQYENTLPEEAPF